jgi:phytoene dehydrogenase-like protein
MSNDYDVIVIGAGLNGLVAATYLARAGRRVLVLERKESVGGIAVTEELIPGYHFSACSDAVSSYLAPEIVADLKLADRGLDLVDVDPLVASPQPDGRCLTIWRDPARTASEIEPFSAADAARYPEFVDYISGLASVVGKLMRITPPDIPDVNFQDLRNLYGLAKPLRSASRKLLTEFGRVLPMPVSDLLNEWFESPELKGAIAANGVRGMTWGPQEAGTAYLLLHRWAAAGDLPRSGCIAKGGIGRVTEALADAARSAGCEIRTGANVATLAVTATRATGVTLDDGSLVSANIVVSGANPRATFSDIVDPGLLPSSFVQHLRNIKFRGSAARVHLALRSAPSFSAIGAGDGLQGVGHIQIAPSMIYIQKAYDPIKYGGMAEHPYLDISIPSLVDSSLAPEGGHTLSATVQYAPYHIDGGWDADKRSRLLETFLTTLSGYAPGVRETVVDSVVFTPSDLEDRYGLPEGNLHHGEMTLDQVNFMRPIPGYARYATPIEGLYLCGAGTHPGGCLTGLPGSNAARQILSGRA